MLKFLDELNMFYRIEPFSLGIFKAGTKEDAKKIMSKGLVLSGGEPLKNLFLEGDYGNLCKRDFEQFLQDETIVLIAVPNGINFQPTTEDNELTNEVFAMIELGKDKELSSKIATKTKVLREYKQGKDGKIPSKFILGYVNVQDDELVLNGNSLYIFLDKDKIKENIASEVNLIDSILRDENEDENNL